jgi:hypothetical protein
MTDADQHDSSTRLARRALMIDGLPVSVLGVVALALGANPDPTGTQKVWWIAITVLFTLAVAWVLVRAFRRGDEYLRKIQLESMAVAFAAVLVALQVATLLDAAGVVQIHQLAEVIVIGGLVVWLTLADLRTRLGR